MQLCYERLEFGGKPPVAAQVQQRGVAADSGNKHRGAQLVALLSAPGDGPRALAGDTADRAARRRPGYRRSAPGLGHRRLPPRHRGAQRPPRRAHRLGRSAARRSHARPATRHGLRCRPRHRAPSRVAAAEIGSATPGYEPAPAPRALVAAVARPHESHRHSTRAPAGPSRQSDELGTARSAPAPTGARSRIPVRYSPAAGRGGSMWRGGRGTRTPVRGGRERRGRRRPRIRRRAGRPRPRPARGSTAWSRRSALHHRSGRSTSSGS
jgi:hypothetical protein